MKNITLHIAASIIIANALFTSTAGAQSIRCVMQHFVSDSALTDQPVSYAMLENGTLTALHIPTAFGELPELRFYERTASDEMSQVGSYALPTGSSYNIPHANGNNIYITVPQTNHSSSPHDLLIIDASDPANPALRSSVEVSKNLNLGDFDANTAYFMNDNFIAPGDAILHAFDITDPENPILRRQVNMGVEVFREEGMQVSGGLMHLSTYNAIITYTIDENGQTQWQHTYPYHVNDVRNMEARGSTLYMQHQGAFKIFDFADPANPVLASQNDAINAGALIRLDGDTAFLLGNSIKAIDISDPYNPFETGVFTDAANISNILVHDNAIYIARSNGVAIYDDQVRYAHRPTEEHIPLPGDPQEMIILDNLAYIANGEARLSIYDVADPTAPQFLTNAGDLTSPSFTAQVDANDTNVFAVIDDTVEIFQRGSFSEPSAISTISGFESITDIDAHASMLAVFGYVETAGTSQTEAVLNLYDVSNPSSPVLRSSTEGFNTPDWVELTDAMLIAYDSSFSPTNPYSGLMSFDIADPTNPIYAGRISLSQSSFPSLGLGQIGRVAIRSNIAYIATPYNSIMTLDIANPYDVQILDEIPTGYNPDHLSIAGDLLAVEANGVYLYDISDPTSLQRAGSAPDLDSASSSHPQPHIVGSVILASNRDTGLIAYDLSTCITCPADLNNDNTLDFFDVSIFLANYIAQHPNADLNNDAMHNFFDVSEFLVQFHGGCP